MHAGLGHAAHAPGKNRFCGGRHYYPSIVADDLLILGSGSGQTAQPVGNGRAGPAARAPKFYCSLPMRPHLWPSLLIIVLLFQRRLRRMHGDQTDSRSMQPLGTLFEQSLLILCDSLILELMQRNGVQRCANA